MEEAVRKLTAWVSSGPDWPYDLVQVTYPVGMNGCEAPIIVSLPESLANGTSLAGGISIYLEVDILQPILGKPDLKALPTGRHSPILMTSPIRITPPKPEREVSMTMEVRNLLSCVVLGMPGHMSGNSTLKGPYPVVVLTPHPHKLRDLSGPMDTSSQVSTPEDTEMAEASLEESLPPSLP